MFNDLFLQTLHTDLQRQANRSVHCGRFLLEICFESSYWCFQFQHRRPFLFASVDKTIKFPLMPMIAAIVIVALTLFLAVLSRWRRIMRVTCETHLHRQMVRAHHRVNPLMFLYFLSCSASSRLLSPALKWKTPTPSFIEGRIVTCCILHF